MEIKKLQALKIIAKLMVENGLGDWHIDLKDVTSYHAQTMYKPKKITYSVRSLTVMNKEQLVGITYHEIAHALVGGGHGHGRVFKNMYRVISGNDNYAGFSTKLNVRKYLFTCPNCENTSTYNDQNERYCRACWMKTRKMHLMLITPNILTLVELT